MFLLCNRPEVDILYTLSPLSRCYPICFTHPTSHESFSLALPFQGFSASCLFVSKIDGAAILVTFHCYPNPLLIPHSPVLLLLSSGSIVLKTLLP
ncbi:hypothetical protein L1887_06106 [Cichorium endivia]|nr:hypothetical protein L1887_06106 [Cichorium endivia]